MNRFIMILIVFAVLCMPAFGQTTAIFDSWNGGSVDNNPTSSASFTISEPHLITYIDTYHYNSGQGVSAGGTISLKRDDGEIFGPWTVTAESGSGAANAWWKCLPYVVIPAGTYTIIDSEPETWSKNSESNDSGFSKVEGHPEKAADVSLDSGKETEAALTTDEALGNKEDKIRIVEPRSKYLTDDELVLMNDFGKGLLNLAPPEVKTGSALKKAHYAYTQYCNLLAKGGVSVNLDWYTRLGNLFRNMDADRWTCGFHEDCLNQIFGGMGLDKNIVELVAQREGTLESEYTDPNFNHIAIAIKDEGDIWVFDPWQQAKDSKNWDYGGAEESMWNGMPAGDWDNILRSMQEYVKFSDNGNDWYDSTAPIVSKYYPKKVPGEPEDAEGWCNTGIDLLYNEKDPGEAIKAFDKAIKLDPLYAKAWFNKGVALEKNGEFVDSEDAFREAIRIDPSLEEDYQYIHTVGANY